MSHLYLRVEGGLESAEGHSEDHEAPDMSLLIEGFVKSAYAHVSDMHHALSEEDAQNLVSLVHTMKGSSMLFGYAGLTKVLCRLERCVEILSDTRLLV